MDNNVLFAFLELCSEFKESNIWLDKQALYACEHKLNANVYDYPMLLLYYPICRTAEYWNKVCSGYVLNSKDKEVIKETANQIWYAVDCRNDVKNDTSSERIPIRKDIYDILCSHFCISPSGGINRNELHSIAGKVWEELGE